jgi:hypothetical protein
VIDCVDSTEISDVIEELAQNVLDCMAFDRSHSLLVVRAGYRIFDILQKSGHMSKPEDHEKISLALRTLAIDVSERISTNQSYKDQVISATRGILAILEKGKYMGEKDSTEKTDLKQIGQDFVKALKGPAISMGDVMVESDLTVDVEPFVGKYYMMQGSIEELLFDGHDLRNGMVVLTEDPMNRQNLANLDNPNSLSYNNAFGMALMYNRWCTVTQLRRGDLQNPKIQFVGVYADGSKRKWRVDQDDAWLVKRDSIPEEPHTAEEMQQAAFPEVISLSLNEEAHYKNIVGDAMTNVLAANGIMPDSRQNGGQFMAILDAAVEEFGRKKSALVNSSDEKNIAMTIRQILNKLVSEISPNVDSTKASQLILDATTKIIQDTDWCHDLAGTDWKDSPEGTAIHGYVRYAMVMIAERSLTPLATAEEIYSQAGAITTKILEHI